MNTTLKNLKEAFAGESQANRKYLAYANKADLEGYPFVAKLFRATAEAETLHAMNHFKNMGAIKSTQENLQDAIEGENYE
ncbi:MAG: rubrerythrin family protein, partial [Caldisericia bacterium]|nr:rubrerythrin family protein [Caldisericia bacterium]